MNDFCNYKFTRSIDQNKTIIVIDPNVIIETKWTMPKYKDAQMALARASKNTLVANYRGNIT